MADWWSLSGRCGEQPEGRAASQSTDAAAAAAGLMTVNQWNL